MELSQVSEEKFIDALFDKYRSLFLHHAFREIALSFCVPTSDFYDTVHECMYVPLRLMADKAGQLEIPLSPEDSQGYDRYTEVYSSNRKLHRLINRLLLHPPKENVESNFFLPKIFDRKLTEAMMSSYDDIAPLLGVQTVEETIRSELQNTLDSEARGAFAFSEFAVLSCLFLSLQSASVNALNQPFKEGCQTKRLNDRLRKIRNTLYSATFRNALIREVFDLIAEFNENTYMEMMDDHCRKYWLPKDKSELKYLDYAMAHHATYFAQITEIEECDKSGNTSIVEFAMQHDILNSANHFFGIICTVAELFATEVLSPTEDFARYHSDKGNDNSTYLNLKPNLLKSDKVDAITKMHISNGKVDSHVIRSTDLILAVKTSDLVSTYVMSILRAVITLLECLPETSVTKGQNLVRYWDSL